MQVTPGNGGKTLKLSDEEIAQLANWLRHAKNYISQNNEYSFVALDIHEFLKELEGA